MRHYPVLLYQSRLLTNVTSMPTYPMGPPDSVWYLRTALCKLVRHKVSSLRRRVPEFGRRARLECTCLDFSLILVDTDIALVKFDVYKLVSSLQTQLV